MENNRESFLLHAVVEGHVQGVGFRYFVMENAELLGLTGWVRNLINGSVEVTAEGTRESLENFLESLRIGPSRSIVTNVIIDWSPTDGKYFQFSLLPTQ